MSVPKKFRGYDFTVEDWLAICEMHGNRCAHCGESKPLTVDHIKPRAAGGTDSLDNIQPLCGPCNTVKSSNHEGKKLTHRDGGKSRGVFLPFKESGVEETIRRICEHSGHRRVLAVKMALHEYLVSHGIDGGLLPPTPERPERVNIKVAKSAKNLALAIASAMSTDEVKWKETDAWEQGVVLLATRKDIKEKLESLTESQIIEILKPLTKQDAPKEGEGN